MEEKIKMDEIEKSPILGKNISENFCLPSKQKVVYLRPFLSSLPFLKFQKQNSMYFGHKHVETGPNCSHEFAIFLKYHMPLRRNLMEF